MKDDTLENLRDELERLRQENARLKAEQTRLRESEAAQQEREAMYRHAIGAADGVVYQFDFLNNEYAYMDERIEQMIGYTVEETTPDLWGRIGSLLHWRGEPRACYALLSKGAALASIRMAKTAKCICASVSSNRS